MLTAEDDDDVVTRRLAAISNGSTRSRVKGDGRNLFVVPTPSASGVHATMTSNVPGTAVDAVLAQTKLRAQLLAIPNLELVVIDPSPASWLPTFAATT
jgi:hypothetical protein